MAAVDRNRVAGVVITLLGIVAVFLVHEGIPNFLDEPPVQLWMAGAGALGLVSGFITGLSSRDGRGTAFMTFLGTGLLIPILGGVATFLGQAEEVTEYSKYLNDQLIERTTKTVTSLSDGSLHPLAVLGSFFLVFGFLAVLGIVGGVLLKEGGLRKIMDD